MRPRLLAGRLRLAALGVLLLLSCSRADTPSLLLAVVVDLSGPGRQEGLQIRDGARLALREATRGGAETPELTLLVQDDRGDPRRAARLAGHLVELPEVIAVVIAPSPATAAAALDGYAAGAGLPVLVAGTCAPDLTEGRPWVFCLAPGPEALGETLAWFLVTELGARGAASFFSADPYGQSFDHGFASELRRLGGDVLEQVPFDSSVADFDLYLAAAQAAPAVLVAAREGEAERAIAALRDGGVRSPILTGASVAGQAPDAGALYRPTLFDPAGAAAARAFVSRYQRAFGRSPGPSAALAYDAGTLVGRATAQGVVARAPLVEWLGHVGDRTPHEGVSARFFFSRAREAVREMAVAPASGQAASGAPPAPP